MVGGLLLCSPWCSFETPFAEMLTEQRRSLRKQPEGQQQRRVLQDMTNHHHGKLSLRAPAVATPPLHLNLAQKLQLQQQMQQVGRLPLPLPLLMSALAVFSPEALGSVCQHVQLLTQVHLLCRTRDNLKHEACMAQQYLVSGGAPQKS